MPKCLLPQEQRPSIRFVRGLGAPRTTPRQIHLSFLVARLHRRIRLPWLFAGRVDGRYEFLASGRAVVGDLRCGPLFFQTHGELDGRPERGALRLVLVFHAAAHRELMVCNRISRDVRLCRHGAVRAAEHRKQRSQSLTGHFLNVSYHGPEWLTGGPRGTEARVLEFLILAIPFLAFARAYPRITD